MDHFCPSRPGVTPGLKDHSYTSVWCNTRPLGPLAACVWCNTRPPGPPLPPSGELLNQLYPVGNSLELCRETPGIPLDHSPGLLPGLEDHLPESSLESRRLLSPCLVKPGLKDSLFPTTSVRDHNCTTRCPKCLSVTLFKDRIRRLLLCFLSESSYFPSV